MPPLTDYLSRRGEVLVLALVVAASAGMMLLSARAKDAAARSLNDATVTPVQAALRGVRGLSGLRSENDSLRSDLARARVRMAELAERGLSVARLEEMLDFRERSRFDVVAARVVAHAAGRPGVELKIDRGSGHGVRRNLAVVSVDGLVGRVSAVDPHSAYVRPLIGRHCRVSARVQRTRTEGILQWSPEGGLRLSLLPFRAEVLAGDEVVSSGLGEVFPRGVRIGQVSSVETDPADGSLRVRIAPAVDFGSLEEVFIVVGEHAQEDAGSRPEEETVAGADAGAGA